MDNLAISYWNSLRAPVRPTNMYILMTSIGLTVFILTRQIYYMLVPLALTTETQ